MGVDKVELEHVGLREWLTKPVRSSEFFDRLVHLMSPPVTMRPGADGFPEPARRWSTRTRAAGAMAEDRERCLALGMDAYVSKPIDVAILRETLARWARLPVVPTETPVSDPPSEPGDGS